MSSSTTIRGFSLIIRTAKLLCKAFGNYWPKVRPVLTSEEQIAGDALKIACDAFDMLFPYGE